MLNWVIFSWYTVANLPSSSRILTICRLTTAYKISVNRWMPDVKGISSVISGFSTGLNVELGYTKCGIFFCCPSATFLSGLMVEYMPDRNLFNWMLSSDEIWKDGIKWRWSSVNAWTAQLFPDHTRWKIFSSKQALFNDSCVTTVGSHVMLIRKVRFSTYFQTKCHVIRYADISIYSQLRVWRLAMVC